MRLIFPVAISLLFAITLFAIEESDSNSVVGALADDIIEQIPSDSDDSVVTPESVETSKNNALVLEEEEAGLLIGDDDLLLIGDDTEETILGTLENPSENEKLDDNQTETISDKSLKDNQDEIHAVEATIDDRKNDYNNDESKFVEEEFKESVIHEAQSINFAKNQKEYRSPRTAMFLSLLLPGLGQAYTKKYWKTGLFGAVEISLIVATILKYNQGQNLRLEKDAFSKKHYNPEYFRKYYLELKDELLIIAENSVAPDSIADFLETELDNKYFFFDSSFTIDNYDWNYVNSSVDLYDEEHYYVQGWDDCSPVGGISQQDDSVTIDDDTYYLVKNTAGIEDGYTYKWEMSFTDQKGAIITEAGFPLSNILGYSLNHRKYQVMEDDENKLFRTARNLGMLIAVNHIISAVDALISARSYNYLLLNKKSVLNHIGFDQQMTLTNDGLQTTISMKVNF